MAIQRYSVNQYQVETLLTWIKTDYIAIPEIQRPFVWNAAKVRDFIDSLYRACLRSLRSPVCGKMVRRQAQQYLKALRYTTTRDAVDPVSRFERARSSVWYYF